MKKVASGLERRRLKDRIVESISRAVKQIQEYQYCTGHTNVVFGNEDWQFHRLCEHLDHAFLHGLRHITNGYWVVVQEFTHAMTKKEIMRMRNIMTNLGRGRAWLYLALSDHLLESYLRCFAEHVKLIKKYYVKEALVLDQQRLQILITLASGLEFVSFQLDVDVPYLDLASHIRVREPAQREEESERVSLCSMDSTLSQNSTATPDSHRSLPDTDSCSQTSADLQGYFRSISQGEGHTDINGDVTRDDIQSNPDDTDFTDSAIDTSMVSFSESEQSRITRISSMTFDTSPDLDIGTTSLEVIHVKSKGQKSKKKRLHKKKMDNDLGRSSSSMTPSPVTPEMADSVMLPGGSGQAKHQESLNPADSKDVSEKSELVKDCNDVGNCLGVSAVKTTEELPSSGKSQVTHDLSSNVSKEKELVDNGYVSGSGDTRSADPNSSSDASSNPDKLCEKNATDPNEQNTYSVDDRLGQTKADPSGQNPCSITVSPVTSSIKSTNCVVESGKDTDSRDGADLRMPGSKAGNRRETAGRTGSLQLDSSRAGPSRGPAEDTLNSVSKTKQNSEKSLSLASNYSNNVEDHGKRLSEGSNHGNSDIKGPRDMLHHGEVQLDNNAKLVLMLELFQDAEEQIIKMFQTTLGHSEGDVQPMYVLLTNRTLYLLKTSLGDTKYQKEATVQYRELDYVSLSINYQIINLVCTNRRKQYWLTTGDEVLTKCIMGHLDNAIRHSELDLPRLSVLTDATTQKIAMRKWAAGECRTEVSDVSLLCYVLTHWEDSQALSSALPTFGPRKEGILLVKTQSTMFLGSVWRPAYFVLKDGMLFQYNDQHDGGLPKLCVHLNGEECGGCRRCPQSDREHSFELILSDGTPLQMSAASNTEAQEWLQSLCQAVAEGVGMTIPSGGCLSCCCVVTGTSILMCHEDVQTNFFRTLGSASITDVTAVRTDPAVTLYCLVEFESQEVTVSSEYWILYFNATSERDGFLSAVMQAWSQHFQVSLPVTHIEDISIQKKCREGVARLKTNQSKV